MRAVLWALLGLLVGGCLERELRPITPCLVSANTHKLAVNNIDKIDLLFVVDNSRSMAGEQAALRKELPRVIRVLTTGERFPSDPNPFPPVQDLHVGVVSTDMGIPGVSFDRCSADGGDDGRLLHVGHGADCSDTYPEFLRYVRDPQQDATASIERFSHDVGCIATLGTEGCGFEQQLEAPLKALLPRVQTDLMGNVLPEQIRFRATTEQGTWARGDLPIELGGNLGFLRDQSLIAVVVVTDEEDCSVQSTEHLKPKNQLSADSPHYEEDINLRCFLHKEFLYDVAKRYYHGLRRLRPGNEEMVLFAAIAGVPPDLVAPEVLSQVDFYDSAQSDAFYDCILSDPRMQEVIDPASRPGTGTGELTPSCSRPALGETEPTLAYPPRRIVQLAKAFGANGIVQSICQDDFGPALNAILNVIAEHIPRNCLPRPLVRQQDGIVPCDVIWELPPMAATESSVPTQCSEREFLEPLEPGRSTTNDRGGQNCKLRQLPVIDFNLPAADGWYYDDFSDELKKICVRSQPRRITFSPAAQPPVGVTVKLECLDEMPQLDEERTDLTLAVSQPTIGSPCAHTPGATRSGDAACVNTLKNATLDTSMFCHPAFNVCMRACASDHDCPAGWVCDDRPESVATSGRPFCSNPICGPEL